jgi:glycine/D-amino acid oxidase-like deaminating enzyme
MINVSNTYIFNPLKFINGLLKDNKFPIYENTSVKKIRKYRDYYYCYTNSNRIKTKYVILATHYPYFLKPFLFPFKVSLEKSYLSASIYNIKPFSLISYSNPFISIRTYKDYLIYLSNSHSINKDVCDKDNFNELLKKVGDLGLSVDYLWSNIDILTSDGLPLIGTLKDNILIGTGYNTWGLTNGFLAGRLLSDIILNKDNSYINLFSPSRKNRNKMSSYISNTYKNVDGFIKGYIKSSSKYICPHLKCKLIYNELEETYDCPCHGSRFNKDGKCINGPSNKDIDIKK